MAIRTKLALIFLFLIILPVSAGTILLFSHVGDVVRDVRLLQLENVANLARDKVELFLAGRKADAVSFQKSRAVGSGLPAVERLSGDRKSPAYLDAYKQLMKNMEAAGGGYGYSCVMLVGRGGAVVAVTGRAAGEYEVGMPLSGIGGEAFEEGRKGVYFTDMHGPDGSYAGLLCTAPLHGESGEFIGEAAFLMDKEDVYGLVRDATGLGETGETYIGMPMGGEVQFINAFHPDRNTVKKRADFFGGKLAMPMQNALSGKDGAGDAVDYLGHDVLAAWRHAPSAGWGLVSKIDASEAYAHINRLKAAALGAGLVFIAFCVAAGGALARSIVEPVRALQRGAEFIGSGDLDFKVGTDKKDEIGQLSRSIDLMAENLKKVTASRDELDKEIVEREKAEEARRRAAEVLRASLRVSEHALHHGLDEVLTKTLDEAEKLTASRIGFFHFVEADQVTLRLQTWSTNTLSSMCTAEGKGAHYPVDKAGVWVDAIMQRYPVVHNDYEALPHRKGLPQGHAPVVRELVAPILRGGMVVGVIGVGNKDGEYDDADVEAVSQLADRAWDIVLAKQAELELDEYRRNLEDIVEARTAELTAANKELEAFSYSVSHDLRAPLRHIQGFVELLTKNSGAAMDDRSARYLSTISDSASRMGALIDDLLTFSRMGRAEMRMTVVDLGKMAGNVVQELRADTEGRDVRWVIGEMPPAYGDPSMLRLVLVNLLSNAVKFTATRAHPVIEFGCLPGDGKGRTFFVRDNGVGFDMRYVDKLFGVFQRLHKSEEFEGTGIGLANVRRIISRHGGRTWAEGEQGVGAAIYFALPEHKEGDSDERA